MRRQTYGALVIGLALLATACGQDGLLQNTGGPSPVPAPGIVRAEKANPALIIWGEKVPVDRSAAENIMGVETAPTATTQNILWGD